ncbi:MAG: translocation/assembly module TamB [Tannerellaceae bacterium]|nr:translocation/assembly module TamB [Tannerellaceae bacterium]
MQKDTGMLLGVKAEWLTQGYRFSLFPDDPVIAFYSFTVNKDNYVIYRSNTDIEADLRLTSEQGASLWIHSLPDGGPMQELHAELSQLDLEVVSDGFGTLPHMKGILNADIQYAPIDSSFQLVADMYVDTLIYERDTVGELMLNATYVPLGNSQQQIDVHLLRNQLEALAANGTIQTGADGQIDGNALLTNFPLEIVTPFIPDDQASLYGFLQGDITVEGSTQSPLLNGYLQFDSAHVFITAVGYSYELDSKRIDINQGIVNFDQYRIFATENDPFIIDGTIDTRNFSRMIADLQLDADNIQLLDAKKTEESIIYGKILIDLHSTIKGPVNALAMRGDLNLQGGTNATFVLHESSLTVQDRLDGLVVFTSFTDITELRNRKEMPRPLGGMDILLTIRIDQSVQLNADIAPDGSNYVQLEGGGDLSFQYDREGDMNLAGRYTLTGGTLRYTLPVVPLKDFSIHEGSYVQFVGDPANPEVNLTATERIRTSVTDATNTRLVNFDVGVTVTGDLDNMALRFTLDAPEDIGVQTQIAAMDEEEETKQAVGMLVTGKYLASSGDGGMNLDMGSAPNNFLQGEINNIAGNALESIDITLGVDSYDENGSAGGSRVTDYSFKFSKRFYDDRIQVIVGGRVSTGGDVNSGDAQSYIDDVSVEYRLDKSGTRYVKVFHDTNYENLLEGEVVETGVGIVLRKKMRYLRELFQFKRKKVKPVEEDDSTDEQQT